MYLLNIAEPEASTCNFPKVQNFREVGCWWKWTLSRVNLDELCILVKKEAAIFIAASIHIDGTNLV